MSDADAIELGRAMVHKNAVGQIDSLKRGRWRALKMHAQAAADDGACFRLDADRYSLVVKMIDP